MTFDMLKELAVDYIATKLDNDKDEWYATPRGFASVEVNGFLNYLQHNCVRYDVTFEKWLERKLKKGEHAIIASWEEAVEAMKAAWHAGYEQGVKDEFDRLKSNS